MSRKHFGQKKSLISGRSTRDGKMKAMVESLEERRLLSGTVTISNTGVVTMTGTNQSDIIAAGVDPNNTSDFYFYIQTPGVGTVTQDYAISQVTGLQIFCDPAGSSPVGADADFVNINATNFFGNTQAVAINGGHGSDTIYGQQGPNQIETGLNTSHNYIQGGPGNDTIVSLGSSDTLRSGGGSDTIEANTGNNILVGGATGSQLIGGSGSDTLRAGRGNATLYGSTGGSLELGGVGNDFIQGGPGNDTIMAGTGQSTVHGMGGNDFIDGGWDSYLVFQGQSALPTPTGTDSLGGGAGNDTIVAINGSPSVVGGSGTNDFDVNDTSATLVDANNGQFVAENDTVTSPTTTININLVINVVSGGTIQTVDIPATAGDSPSGTSAVRATDANGDITFQSSSARVFTLGDFFNHWGVYFSSTGIGQLIANANTGHTMAMTVNGVNNTAFQNYAVQNGDAIVITFTQ